MLILLPHVGAAMPLRYCYGLGCTRDSAGLYAAGPETVRDSFQGKFRCYTLGCTHQDFPITPEQAIELEQTLVELGLEAQQMAQLDQQLVADTRHP